MDTVDAALARHAAYIDEAPRIFVGFSGGLDSTVLLHALRERSPDRVVALHANHGLHADAALWQRHCEQLCAAFGLPLRSSELAIESAEQGAEAAARAARYHWFEQCLEAGDLLLLAHHQDDQAETVLLRLLRGAGPEGLAGMPATRPLGRARLLRPFLALPRRALEDHARAHDLRWVEDPSNAQRDFDRNYLRHEVLPLLEARWPGYRKTFTRAASQLGALVAEQPVVPLADCVSALGDPGFRLADLPESAQSAAHAVRGWLKRAGLRMPSASRLREFIRQLQHGAGARLATSEWVLERYREAVFCYSPTLSAAPERLPIVPGETQPWGDLGTVHLECSRDLATAGELILRPRRGGERLATAAGQHRDLKHVLQDCGVPPWWRPRLPLLLRAGSGGEELLAVGPCAHSAAALSEGIALRWDVPVFDVK